ncbi:hypothetical protein BKA64DRAFT_652609 [Cadophora sp. MPI-SDFR-AT-0126]|nr:hypothetical protein BKA64DRAFT_652609 [Leotiomycetes sp. MPI-SDFR-AT-0126]
MSEQGFEGSVSAKPSATDIITYIGVPIAVLGILPVLYNFIKSWFIYIHVRSVLRHAHVLTKKASDATIRTKWLSGNVEAEISVYDLSLCVGVFEGTESEIVLDKQLRGISGASWLPFSQSQGRWNSERTGYRLVRTPLAQTKTMVYNKLQVRLPEAGIEFEDLLQFLLLSGAYLDLKEFGYLRTASPVELEINYNPIAAGIMSPVQMARGDQWAAKVANFIRHPFTPRWSAYDAFWRQNTVLTPKVLLVQGLSQEHHGALVLVISSPEFDEPADSDTHFKTIDHEMGLRHGGYATEATHDITPSSTRPLPRSGPYQDFLFQDWRQNCDPPRMRPDSEVVARGLAIMKRDHMWYKNVLFNPNTQNSTRFFLPIPERDILIPELTSTSGQMSSSSTLSPSEFEWEGWIWKTLHFIVPPRGCYFWLTAEGISQRVVMHPVDPTVYSETEVNNNQASHTDEDDDERLEAGPPGYFLSWDYVWEANRPRHFAFISHVASAICELPVRSSIPRLRVDATLVFACVTWTVPLTWIYKQFPGIEIHIPMCANGTDAPPALGTGSLSSLRRLALSSASLTTFLPRGGHIGEHRLPLRAKFPNPMRSSHFYLTDIELYIRKGLWKAASGNDKISVEDWPSFFDREKAPSDKTLLYLLLGASDGDLKFRYRNTIMHYVLISLLREETSPAVLAVPAGAESKHRICFFCAVLVIWKIAQQADNFCDIVNLRACLDKYPYVYLQ